MMRLALAALAISAVAGAPVAGADPQDLEPYCTGGQVPAAGECLPPPGDVSVDSAGGANPGIPVGVNPESVPEV